MMRALIDILVGPRIRRPLVELPLFFLGAGLCCSFLLSDPHDPVFWFVMAAIMALRSWSGLGTSRARIPAHGVVLALTTFWIYEAIAFGLLLAWTTPYWVRVLTPILLVLVVVPIRGVRVPLVLALGPFILMCLLGWRDQDGMLRCSDLRRVVEQPGVRILVPTFPSDLPTRCTDDQTFVIGRYPRHVWQSPEEDRLVVTTQFYAHFAHPGIALPSNLTGSICDVKLDGSAPRCFGQGTAHGIAESANDDRLYIAAYQQRHGSDRGVVYATSSSDALDVKHEHWFAHDTLNLYADPRTGTLGVITDEGDDLLVLRMADLAALTVRPGGFTPDELQYDPARGEGVFCHGSGPLFTDHGRGYASIVFEGATFSYHLLAPTPSYPTSWLTLTSGCDWDPGTRRVFVASENLGWLGILDADSGRYRSRRFVGIGIRAVAWDPRRHVVYLADFLRGQVFAVEPETGRETARWYVGRFVRQVVLTRDGDALLATGNVGVLRIELP